MLGGKQAWKDHAAAVAARVELQQITVMPDWHYTVCTRCGWELEADRLSRQAFRYAVATHECSPLEEIPLWAAAPAAPVAAVLF
jgi:RNA polymerase-binding transcription factor DksA